MRLVYGIPPSLPASSAAVVQLQLLQQLQHRPLSMPNNATISGNVQPRATNTSGLETVMKAAFYNQHAATQTDALQHLLPLLQTAAQLVRLPSSGHLQVNTELRAADL
jgi:hypothetical protein